MADGAHTDGNDDLDGWLERLADGEPPDPALVGLRILIAREGRRAEESTLGQLASPQAEQRAVERLRARLSEIQPRLPRAAKRPRRFAKNVRWAVPALCAVLLALGIPLYRSLDADYGVESRDEAPPTTRSAINLIQVVDTDPVRRAQRVSVSLKHEVSGLILYTYGDRAALDLEIDAANLQSAARAVKDEAIANQLRAGMNRIEVLKP